MKRSICFALAMAVLSIAAFGQSATGRLVGTVSGPDGVLPGATIVITDNQTQQQRTLASNSDGVFEMPQLAIGSYTVVVTAPGFKSFTANDVKIEVGKEYSLNARLEIGGVNESITVVAGEDLVNSTNAELSSTVTNQQLYGLPINGRNPSSLIQLQPGVTQAGEINGVRTSGINVTRDGLNVQDNYIRTGNFNPDRPTIDDVGEFTVVTQNAGASQGSGGSSQVQYVTPRGGRRVHGALFEYNQNSALGSNDFFNNRRGEPKPFLNQNQFGGKVSGPIAFPHFGEGGPVASVSKKAYFFFEYEGLRLPQSVSVTRTVLTPTARQGIFTYTDDNGNVRQDNILTRQGLSLNPLIASRILASMPQGNDTSVGDNVNTTGYSFKQRADVTLNAATTRLDFDANQSHTFNFVWKRDTDNFLRPDADTGGFGTTPFTTQDSLTNLVVGAWNWTISSKLNNELRGGYQKSNPFFHASGLPSDFIITVPTLSTSGLAFTDTPENAFLDQGRTTKYYNIQDNAVYTMGAHSIRFGGQGNLYRISSFGGAAIPEYFLDNTNFPFGYVGTAGELSGPLTDPNQLAVANALQAELGGLVSFARNTFNVTSKTSGFVPGAPQILTFNYDNWSGYVSDQWRVSPRLTLNLGLRYELYTGIKDPAGLRLEPVVQPGQTVEQALLNPNGTYDFVGGNAGHAGQFFKTDKNNFAPVLGFAYSPQFSNRLLRGIFPANGETVIRGGYRSSYINDEYLRSADNALQNGGLTQEVDIFDAQSFINNPPPIPIPTFVPPPLTYAQQNELQGLNGLAFLIDPKIQLPRTDEYNFGIQRSLGFNTVLEARYVGGRSKSLVRVVDLNQIDIRSNGFVEDFTRARANLLLSPADNPDPACTFAGCQPLTVFPQLVGGGFLTDPSVLSQLRAGTAADLARLYVLNGLVGNVQFLPNPNLGIADLLGNRGRYNYNALQVEVRHRFSKGLFFQANYTFQKTLSDISPGNPGVNAEDQTRIAAFLDNANPRQDYGRVDYDQTHIFNFNSVYDLPFGKGRTFFGNSSGVVDRIVGGWQLGAILRINTGTPLTIVDPRGTLNRAGRSANQTALTNLTADQIRKLIGITEQNGNIYFIDPSVINAQGRATNGFGQTPFSGQVFFNNGPGQSGNLVRGLINGPLFSELDMSLTKNFRITESVRFQIRADAFNVLNHVNFNTGVVSSLPGGGINPAATGNTIFNINSGSFGKISQAYNFSGLNRLIQVAGRFEF